MKCRDFSELCIGASAILSALADQAGNGKDEMVFDGPHAAETIRPLAEIIEAICEDSK